MASDDPIARCVHCAKPIGVYEPAFWLMADGSKLAGSRLAPPAIDDGRRPVAILHRHCVEQPAP